MDKFRFNRSDFGRRVLRVIETMFEIMLAFMLVGLLLSPFFILELVANGYI